MKEKTSTKENFSIYTVFMCEKIKENKGLPEFGCVRVVGFYRNEENAIEAVKNNLMDICEYCYRYAISQLLGNELPSLS